MCAVRKEDSPDLAVPRNLYVQPYFVRFLVVTSPLGACNPVHDLFHPRPLSVVHVIVWQVFMPSFGGMMIPLEMRSVDNQIRSAFELNQYSCNYGQGHPVRHHLTSNCLFLGSGSRSS